MKMKDMDFLFLVSMIRAREVRMLTTEKINRMLESPSFDDAAKSLTDCGYPDMSAMSMDQIDEVIDNYRQDVFSEFSAFVYVHDLLDLFRLKYDYHNVKVLVKSTEANVEGEYLLSNSGRVDTQLLKDAFLTGQYDDIPPLVSEAIDAAVGVLSRTQNPQLADIEIDKVYFKELVALGNKHNRSFISGYVRLIADSANLRIIVRSARIGRDADFLRETLIEGGSMSIEDLVAAYEDNAPPPFTDEALALAVRLGTECISGGSQTLFELACDNAVLQYVTNTKYVSFGPVPLITFFAKLEWELTVVRMVLTGKYSGIPADIIRERLRECYV